MTAILVVGVFTAFVSAMLMWLLIAAFVARRHPSRPALRTYAAVALEPGLGGLMVFACLYGATRLDLWVFGKLEGDWFYIPAGIAFCSVGVCWVTYQNVRAALRAAQRPVYSEIAHLGSADHDQWLKMEPVRLFARVPRIPRRAGGTIG